jgi:hypothetical protein
MHRFEGLCKNPQGATSIRARWAAPRGRRCARPRAPLAQRPRGLWGAAPAEPCAWQPGWQRGQPSLLPTARQRDANRPAAQAALTGPLTAALTGHTARRERVGAGGTGSPRCWRPLQPCSAALPCARAAEHGGVGRAARERVGEGLGAGAPAPGRTRGAAPGRAQDALGCSARRGDAYRCREHASVGRTEGGAVRGRGGQGVLRVRCSREAGAACCPSRL